MRILIVVPTLDAGAADTNACDLVRMLVRAGYRPIVVARGGRLVQTVIDAGGDFVPMNVASNNPLVMGRCAVRLARLVRTHDCAVVHALGRASAWSALIAARLTRRPFLTSCYKGFRDQNPFKRYYNGVMARGERVITASEQIAELMHDRYGAAWERIAVIPTVFDAARFDPARVTADRIARVRQHWGVSPACRVVLVPGRMLRRKGHHVVVQAAQLLKTQGVTNFKCVFIGEDQGHTRYTGELWDLVTTTGTNDVIRLAGTTDDRPAALAAATAVVSASIQAEGIQRAVLEAQAMAVPVVVSDLAAGPDVVLAPPAIAENRMTGLRCTAADAGALATALGRVLATPEPARQAIGQRGRAWVLDHFDEATVADSLLRLYAGVIGADAPHLATPAI